MAYRIAGIDVHKKMLAVVIADVDGRRRRSSLNAGRSARARANCARWPNGSSSARSRKW